MSNYRAESDYNALGTTVDKKNITLKSYSFVVRTKKLFFRTIRIRLTYLLQQYFNRTYSSYENTCISILIYYFLSIFLRKEKKC